MPPERHPLADRTNLQDLSPYQRGFIVGLSAVGHKPKAISQSYEIDRTTVHRTLNQQFERSNGKSLPQSGRPRKTTIETDQLIAQTL